MEPSPDVAALIAAFYARWNGVFHDGDCPGHEDVWADEYTSIGTDPEEFTIDSTRSKVRFLRLQQHEEAGEGPRIAGGDVHAWEEGLIGWAVDRPRWILTHRPDVPLRLSAVARRQPRGWRLVHLHLSIGVSNEEAIGMRLTTSIDDMLEGGKISADPDQALPRRDVTIVFSDIESSTATLVALG